MCLMNVCVTQEQALHAVHTILMLVDKETNPRLEKHPGLQVINTPKHTRCALQLRLQGNLQPLINT